MGFNSAFKGLNTFRFSFLSENLKECALVVIRDASTIPIIGWMTCSYSEVTISFLVSAFPDAQSVLLFYLARLTLSGLPGSGQFTFPASYVIRTCSSDSIAPPDTTAF
jgi:hypothetical protein